MYNILKINYFLLFIGFLLTINDLLSFGLCKYIYSDNLNIFYLLIPTIMYSFQIPIFFYGLKTSSMSVLNIVWNLMSSILVTFVGLFYFKEKISNIKKIAVFLGIFSLILFSFD
jgi:multidrug transporter EmrE-like cation transporter